MWTEYIDTPEHAEYMVLPRLLAMAEVTWTPVEGRGWADFLARLPAHLDRLDRLGYTYRVPDVQGLEDALTLEDGYTLRLRVPVKDAVIRYTLDGTEPTADAPAFAGPVRIPVDNAGVTVSARAFLADGRTSAIRTARIRRATRKDAVAAPPSARGGALRMDYLEGVFERVAQLSDAPVTRSALTDAVTLPDFARPERYGLVFTGWIDVPEDGVYAFHLTSDDGAVLRIGGDTVVDHDGPHGPTERTGRVALRRGLHAVELRYFQAGGGQTLALEVTPPGGGRMAVPSGWWWYAT